jgi:tyrosinase
MMAGTSPNDPVFFLHHCNIDRLWAIWQSRHPGQNYPLSVPFKPHALTDHMPPWVSPPEQIRPVDMLNHQSLGYSYDTDPRSMRINVSP